MGRCWKSNALINLYTFGELVLDEKEAGAPLRFSGGCIDLLPRSMIERGLGCRRPGIGCEGLVQVGIALCGAYHYSTSWFRTRCVRSRRGRLTHEHLRCNTIMRYVHPWRSESAKIGC